RPDVRGDAGGHGLRRSRLERVVAVVRSRSAGILRGFDSRCHRSGRAGTRELARTMRAADQTPTATPATKPRSAPRGTPPGVDSADQSSRAGATALPTRAPRIVEMRMDAITTITARDHATVLLMSATTGSSFPLRGV